MKETKEKPENEQVDIDDVFIHYRIDSHYKHLSDFELYDLIKKVFNQ